MIAAPLFTLALPVLLEALPYAILLCDVHGKIVFWNRHAETVFGYSGEEIVGHSVNALLPPGQPLLACLDFAEGADNEFPLPAETVCVTRSGIQILVSLTISPIQDTARQTLGSLIVACRSEERGHAHLHNDRLASLTNLVSEITSHVADDMLSSQSGLSGLAHVVEAARTMVQAQYAALGVARPDGAGLLAFITAGLSPEEEKAIGSRPTGKGILNLLLDCEKPLRMDRLSDHAESAGFPPKANLNNYRAKFSAILISKRP